MLLLWLGSLGYMSLSVVFHGHVGLPFFTVTVNTASNINTTHVYISNGLTYSYNLTTQTHCPPKEKNMAFSGSLSRRYPDIART